MKARCRDDCRETVKYSHDFLSKDKPLFFFFFLFFFFHFTENDLVSSGHHFLSGNLLYITYQISFKHVSHPCDGDKSVSLWPKNQIDMCIYFNIRTSSIVFNFLSTENTSVLIYQSLSVKIIQTHNSKL